MMKPIKFVFPSDNKKNFQEYKDRMRNFEETKIVDDPREVHEVVAKTKFIQD